MAKIRFVFVEDETAAARRLQKMILELRPEWQLVHTLDSVEEAVNWLQEEEENYDLLFLDVQLSDGLSFEIFKDMEMRKPIIFTTAYDQYALRAFKVNSLDYLLKPVKAEELRLALEKFEQQYRKKEEHLASTIDYSKLAAALQQREKNYQKRLVVKIGETVKALELSEAAYFYAQEKVIFMRQHGGRDYPLDHNLDQLESLLDPKEFFRINRQYIVNFKAIASMHAWSKSRLKLELKPAAPTETVVSTYRSGEFKDWLEAK